MIGFLTTAETLATVDAGLSAAFAARGVQQYLTLGARQVLSGEHEGKWFIPFSDAALDQPLYGGHHVHEFPEFEQLIALLGGLDARVDLADEDITPPAEP